MNLFLVHIRFCCTYKFVTEVLVSARESIAKKKNIETLLPT